MIWFVKKHQAILNRQGKTYFNTLYGIVNYLSRLDSVSGKLAWAAASRAIGTR